VIFTFMVFTFSMMFLSRWSCFMFRFSLGSLMRRRVLSCSQSFFGFSR
jgi:hypothetical protein